MIVRMTAVMESPSRSRPSATVRMAVCMSIAECSFPCPPQAPGADARRVDAAVCVSLRAALRAASAAARSAAIVPG